MSFGEKILKYREDILKDLAEMVAIPSVRSAALEGMPFGEESARSLETILKIAGRLGLKTENVGNYAGHAEYGDGGDVAAVVTHVDVVPAGDGWETDPFTMVKKGNLYYGRGTADDKGEAVVALYCLKALKDENITAKRRIRAIFGAGEETDSDDLERYLAAEEMPVMAFTPDAEYGICNREKGMLRLSLAAKGNDSAVVRGFSAGTVINAVPAGAAAELACTGEEISALKQAAQTAKGEFRFEPVPNGVRVVSSGKASHAMQPQLGFNAATHLVSLLARVFSAEKLGRFLSFVSEKIGTEFDGASLGVKQSDKESGPLTLNAGLLHIDENGASLGIDIRYPVLSDGDGIFSAISAQAAAFGLETTVLGSKKPLYLPESSPFITLLKDSYRAVTGGEATVYATGGGTYARAFKGRAVAFGPFFPDEPDRRLHNSNENIDIDRFMVHAQICLEAMYRMITE
ncbi:MAG: M20 family metallopeptidase [Clostridiales bacterium]|nr:M20 family metallopeptidase [Clostridiales bacterium]